MFKRVPVVTFCLALLWPCAARAERYPIVKLTVEEEAGVARVNEPVTVGVPFAPSAVLPKDLPGLGLTAEGGAALPCQFVPAAKWPDGSIKWVHLDFQCSVGAGQKTRVIVMGGRPPPPPPKTHLKAVKQANGDIVVTTGPVRFEVKGKNFRGFSDTDMGRTENGKFVAARRVIGGETGGGGFTLDDGEYLTRFDGDSKASIEVAGPMKVVVKVEGSHKNAKGERKIDYVCRFYAYNNSPVVRVAYTFVNRQGTKPSDHFGMLAHYFDVPTQLAGGNVVIGAEGKARTGRLVKEGGVSIYQDTSDHYRLRVVEMVSEGKGKSTKPLDTGWAALEKDGVGVAVGVRWFWQTFPKSIKILPDGNIHLGLYPAEFKDEENFTYPRPIYMGVARTHYLTFLFYQKRKPVELRDFFIGTQRPLQAWAPGRYYLRDTHCFGYAAESDPKLYNKEAREACKKYDDTLTRCIDKITDKLDGHTYTVFRDSYGFFAWGDTFHWAWNKNTPHDKNISWAGNYYDFPNAALMQYLRTDEKKFRDRWFVNAIHVGDVFTCHYHPRKELIGACRYCPPRNHIGVDNGRPYVSNEYNHNKSQCVFAHYYLTGDLRTLDNIKLMMNNGLANRAADRGWAWRGIGAQLALLWQSYELTRDEKYRTRAAGMAKRAWSGRARSKSFYGIALEGVVYYHWMTGDPAAKAGLLKMIGDRRDGGPTKALGLAYAYHLTGEDSYRNGALKALGRAKYTSRPKSFGMMFRNSPFAWYYVSNVKNKLPKVE